MRKTFIIDTSVLIHDPECIYSFTNNEVCIPIFVIIELDDLKISKRSNVAYSARTASRTLVSIQEYGSLNDPDGIHLEEEDIIVRVIGSTNGVGVKSLQESNNPRKMDLWILQCALDLQEEIGEESEVILVSKDMNMRILAEAEGLIAQDYESDKVPVETLYSGFREIGEQDFCETLYVPNVEISAKEKIEDSILNEFYLAESFNKNFLMRNVGGVLKAIPKEFNVSIEWRNQEQRMALDILLDESISLVSLVGKAGTGKTFLALACAMAQLHSPYEKIILSKPTVDMGRGIGFLPGDLDEKLAPWMQSYFDNLDQLIPGTADKGTYFTGGKKTKNWTYLIDTDTLQIQPINSIRGRSISKAIMIIDEAQNLTPHEVKTLITRAAEGTKIILSGDPFQVDDPFLDQNSNGLTYVTQRMKGSEIFATVFFTEGVRSRLAEEAANKL